MYRVIRVTEECHNALNKIGRKGDTFSDVIMHLVNFYRERNTEQETKTEEVEEKRGEENASNNNATDQQDVGESTQELV